ncbi:MAG: hypothetical protein H6872_11090 [Methylobacteriaceae bacterium]|nr:hypothetical protein [Methylobacteriaceae bacterium]
MAMIDHAPEITDEREYAIHVENYRGFLHVLWSVVTGIALTLILLAIFFG